MGAPTETVPRSGGGWRSLDNISKEKEKTRDSEQLPIYTGGEYLAPVCKAFNGELSFLKDRFALCHLFHDDWFLICSRCSCFSCSIPDLTEEFGYSQLIDNLMRDSMIYRLKDLKIYKSKCIFF